MKQKITTLTLVMALCMLCTINLNAQTPNNAYGDNMKQVDVINGNPVFAIFSGDINQDGVCDLFDQISLDNDIYNNVYGYVLTDLTGDGVVDLFDQILLDNHIQEAIYLRWPGE